MIEINLIPPELRKGKKRQLLPGGIKIPIEVVIGSAGGLLLLLIMVHVGLLFVNVSQLTKHKKLEKRWNEILPAKQNVDKIINELRQLQVKSDAVKKIAGAEDVLWAQKLNIVSDALPRGVWLTKVALTEDMFFIEGSSVARQDNEMITVHKYTANLKKDKALFEDLTELDLSSIQSRKVQSKEIADFLLTLKIKGKHETAR